MNFCFNCGRSFSTLTEERRTRDHIPPQCFYRGFPEGYKANRKTVPCCFKCNNNFSRIDELFRDVLGFSNDILSNKQITVEAVKSLFEKGKLNDDSDEIPSITIDKSDILNFHKRCFKALHVKAYKEYLDETLFKIVVIHEHDYENAPAALKLCQFLMKDNSWSVSGHSNVFKYCIKQIGFDDNQQMITASSLASADFVGIVMVYLDCYAVVIFAQKLPK